VSRAGAMIIEGFEVECSIGDRVVYTMNTVFGFFPPDAFENQVGLAVTDSDRAALDAAGEVMVDLTLRPARFCAGSACLAEPMLLMIDRFTHLRGAGAAGLGVVRGEKDVDVSEWFFKAHFFQDPVQPGSLGIEALLQLLQCFMLDTDLAAGLPEPRFEPIMLGAPLTWKYRGQVTPNNALITTVMEIIEVGVDDRGPFVIGNGSLWCDGLRIYEVVGMGMRIVSGAAGTSVLRFCVDGRSHPQLADHSINGVVVVPMVFALEWLARSAKAHPAAGGMNLAALSDVTVLKGLVVDQFAAEGRLDLVASARILSTSEHGLTLAVELVDEATGRTHYRCVASFTKLAPAPSTLAAPARGRLAAGVVYDNPVLFHGAAFHVIESIEPMSNGGVTATLAGVLACDWPSEPWVLDPALLDGALQMALVWTEHVLGLPSLPTAIASVCVFSAPCHGRFAAVLRGRTNSPHRVVCDVEIFDDRGALVAEVLGIETHVLPAASAR